MKALTPIGRYQRDSRRKISMIVVGVLLCAVVFVCDILVGTYGLTAGEMFYTLIHPADRSVMAYIIVWTIRLPPAVTGILAGVALSLAGATMQTILNNPLATPYTLGVSSGAGLGAYSAIVIGLFRLGPVSAACICFCFCAGCLPFHLCHRKVEELHLLDHGVGRYRHELSVFGCPDVAAICGLGGGAANGHVLAFR